MFLVVGTAVFAQSYEEKFYVADSLVYASTDSIANAKKGYQLYKELYKEVPEQMTFWYLYDLAYAANKFKDEEKGFYWLRKALEHYKEKDANYLIDEDAKSDFYNLIELPEWNVFEREVSIKVSDYIAEIKNNQQHFIQSGLGNINQLKAKKAKSLYKKIGAFNSYPEIPSEVFGYIQLDSIEDNFFARIPSAYNPKIPSKVLFFLNGAVRYQEIPTYPTAELEENWQRFYKIYAEKYNVIMVYPNCNKQYNWMLGDKGFAIVPKILRELKKFINIDDNQVYVTGHSNGATGSFNYAMKNPNEFAGFYGMNTQPKVYTGGTFLKNLSNRSFYNISTDQDYYFPPKANDTLMSLAKNLQLNYQDNRYNGFPHWFPQFDTSEVAIKRIFKDLITKKRNPYPAEIYWECDDVNYGKVDWLSITELDTLQQQKKWHQKVNFNIHEKLMYNKEDSLVAKKVLEKAFYFPRKSGAVKASFHNNRFDLETSRVEELTIYISPEMVNMKKPISVFVNGEQVYNKRIRYNKDFILANFMDYYDRKTLWVNEIKLKL